MLKTDRPIANVAREVGIGELSPGNWAAKAREAERDPEPLGERQRGEGRLRRALGGMMAAASPFVVIAGAPRVVRRFAPDEPPDNERGGAEPVPLVPGGGGCFGWRRPVRSEVVRAGSEADESPDGNFEVRP